MGLADSGASVGFVLFLAGIEVIEPAGSLFIVVARLPVALVTVRNRLFTLAFAVELLFLLV